MIVVKVTTRKDGNMGDRIIRKEFTEMLIVRIVESKEVLRF